MTTRRAITFSLAYGALGATAIILSHMFFTPGKYLLVTYAAVVLGGIMALKSERYETFNERFWATFLGFVVYAGAHYVWLLAVRGVGPVGILGHGWRLAFLFGIGAALSMAGARLSAGNTRESLASV